MKLALFLTLALTTATASAIPGSLYCYGEDGSDLSISIEGNEATLSGEDVNETYALSGVLESLPPQYVYGERGECTIRFKPARSGDGGTAYFSCNEEKYPDALNLEMECSAE